MIGRERIMALFEKQPTDRVGYWSGAPHPDTARIYGAALGVNGDSAPRSNVDLAVALGDDAIWIPAEWDAWSAPDGSPIWPAPELEDWIGFESCVFAAADDVGEVAAYPWPDPANFDFTSIEAQMHDAHRAGLAVLGGPWCSVSTVLMGLFGTEELLVKMHTHPKVVEAAIEHVTEFYVAAVRRFFTEVEEYPEVFFFASDLGTQQDLLMSPEMFRRFIQPALAAIAKSASAFGLPIMLHSCGAVSKLIPDFLEMGVRGLHPLQARARGMSADELAEYRDDLVFVGGVDTQDLLPHATPEDVCAAVSQLKDAFGERYVVSPSHEALLPNVPLDNVLAMREAAVANPHWRLAAVR